jgi:hypothetical protein
MKTDKIIEILKQYRYSNPEDTGREIPEEWFENLAKEIDSLYPTLNRDRVRFIVQNICTDLGFNDTVKLIDAICSFSLPTLREWECKCAEPPELNQPDKTITICGRCNKIVKSC